MDVKLTTFPIPLLKLSSNILIDLLPPCSCASGIISLHLPCVLTTIIWKSENSSVLKLRYALTLDVTCLPQEICQTYLGVTCKYFIPYNTRSCEQVDLLSLGSVSCKNIPDIE